MDTASAYTYTYLIHTTFFSRQAHKKGHFKITSSRMPCATVKHEFVMHALANSDPGNLGSTLIERRVKDRLLFVLGRCGAELIYIQRSRQEVEGRRRARPEQNETRRESRPEQEGSSIAGRAVGFWIAR
jgi:hypothetical protein